MQTLYTNISKAHLFHTLQYLKKPGQQKVNQQAQVYLYSTKPSIIECLLNGGCQVEAKKGTSFAERVLHKER
jgi:hypothetical protein